MIQVVAAPAPVVDVVDVAAVNSCVVGGRAVGKIRYSTAPAAAEQAMDENCNLRTPSCLKLEESVYFITLNP